MKTYSYNDLAAMHDRFIEWLESNWCECATLRKKYPEMFDEGQACICYGRDEYDTIESVAIDDDNNIVLHVPAHNRNICFPDGDFVDAYITDHTSAMQWVGDDVDYYASIAAFIKAIS